MRRRQTAPTQWLIVTGSADVEGVRRLAPGSGVLLLDALPQRDMQRLRQLVRLKGLVFAREGPEAARVHNVRELRRALLARTPLILLSPIFPTRSHPGWKPIHPMRAAAMARLGGRKLLALGGMNARTFARITRMGFQAWAGISAFRT